MIAKVGDSKIRQDLWFQNRLVSIVKLIIEYVSTGFTQIGIKLTVKTNKIGQDVDDTTWAN